MAETDDEILAKVEGVVHQALGPFGRPIEVISSVAVPGSLPMPPTLEIEAATRLTGAGPVSSCMPMKAF